MSLARVASMLCVFVLAVGSSALCFDYASYKPGDLDDVLAMPRPKTGMDMSSPSKLALKVTLESYAKKCGIAAAIKLSASMLRGVYPKPFVDALSMSKCVTVKSPKGISVSLAIQDKVADFLPKEVPLGTEIKVYCVLVCMTADGPGLVIAEFEAPEATTKTGQLLRTPDLVGVATVKGMEGR